MLLDYFKKYIQLKGLSARTVVHYVTGINTINALLERYGFPIKNIFESCSITELDAIKEFLSTNEEFQIKNSIGHNMYSVALGHFYKFVCGDMSFLAEHIKDMDIVSVKPQIVTVAQKKYKRNQIIIDHCLEAADYCCEHNAHHQTFIAKATGRSYMEGHHLIPMKYQTEFNNSIDVYANIICLCPICHKQIHFGTDNDRRYLAEELYEKRNQRLISSGIDLSKPEFLKLVM